MLLEDREAVQLDLFAASGDDVDVAAKQALGLGPIVASRRGHSGIGAGDDDLGRPVVAVIDDEGRIRRPLVALLEQAGYRTLYYVGVDALLAAPGPQRPHLLLLDIRLPGGHVLGVLRQLADRDDPPSVLVLTGSEGSDLAVTAINRATAEALPGTCPQAALLASVENALLVHEQMCRQRRPGENARARVDALPPRQRQVLAGVVCGYANKAMARALGLSVRTIEDYRARLLEKLGVRCTAEAIRIGLEAGLDGETFVPVDAD